MILSALDIVEAKLENETVEASRSSSLLAAVLLAIQTGNAGALRSLLRTSSEASDYVGRHAVQLSRVAQRNGERAIVRLIEQSKDQNIPNFVSDGQDERPRADTAKSNFDKLILGDVDDMKRAMRMRPNDFASCRVDGENPLVYHARNGNYLNVKALLESGEYTPYLIEERDRSGKTALQSTRNQKIAELLKEYGAAE